MPRLTFITAAGERAQPTPRLGCQIVLTEELDGLTVRLPDSC